MSTRPLIAALLLGAVLAPLANARADEVNLYTTREPGLMQPLIEAFTAETGVAVNTIFLKDGVAERVAAEGTSSPADVLMTVDLGKLVDLVDAGLTQPLDSEAMNAAVPAPLRDANGNWFALSMRARVAYAAPDLKLETLTYENLADPVWKGRICIRSGQHPYNTALVAAFLVRHGEDATRTWLKGVKANLARKPGGGDRDVARDITGDLCDLGIGNSYYVGLMRGGHGGPESKAWGDGIDVVLPVFEGGGTHVNISGAALAKHAPNRDKAVRFLEFLVSDEAQAIYARANFEYPVKAGVAIDPIIAALGDLTIDDTHLEAIARQRKAASELIDEVGFDQ